MKKGLLISLMVILFVLVVAGVWIFIERQKVIKIEEVIPPGPVFYLKVSRLADVIDQLKMNPLIEQIKHLDQEYIYKQLHWDENQKTQAAKITKAVFSKETESVIKKILGREFVLAFYPVRFAEFDNQAVTQILANMIIVIRVDTLFKVEDLLKLAALPAGQSLSIKSKEMNHKRINTIFLSGMPILYFRQEKDLLILSLDENTIVKSIAAQVKNKHLLGDPAYLKVSSRFLTDAHFAVFLEFEKIFKDYRSQLFEMSDFSKENPSAKDNFERMVDKLNGFEQMGLSLHAGRLTKGKVDIFYNLNNMQESVSRYYTCGPKENQSTRFVPEGILFYYWVNCLDLPFYWEELKKDVASAAADVDPGRNPLAYIDALEKGLQMDIENDILPSVGDEMGGFISDIQIQSALLIPQIGFFVSLHDQKKIDRLLSRFSENPKFNKQMEDYQGVRIQYFVFPVNVSLQPSYCFLGDYLVLATDLGLVKKMIDAYQNNSPSLKEDHVFKQDGFGSAELRNSDFYINSEKFLQKIQQMVGWGLEWLKNKEQQKEAFRLGTEKRFADLGDQKVKIEEDIARISSDIDRFRSDLAKKKKEEADIASLELLIDDSEKKVNELKSASAGNLEQEQELLLILKGYKNQKTADISEMKMFADKIITPILEGLSYLKSTTLKVTNKDNIVEILLNIL